MPDTRVLRCPVCQDAFGPGLQAVPSIRQHMTTAHDWRVFMVLGEDRQASFVTIVATWGTSLPFRQDVRWEDRLPLTSADADWLADALASLERHGLDKPHQEGAY